MGERSSILLPNHSQQGEPELPSTLPNQSSCEVRWLSPEEDAIWDAFVLRHPLGLVYHLSVWRKALERAFDHIRGRFLVLVTSNGEIQAGLPVYSVSSWLLKNRTVSVPFATFCDPLASSKQDLEALWQKIAEEATSNKSRRVEIRTWRLSKDDIPSSLRPGAQQKHHYLHLGQDEKALFRSFHDSCVCRRVKKAARLGIVVEERRDDVSLRQFHSLMSETRRRLLLPPMPFKFFESMYRCLGPQHASLYLAIHDGKAVGGMLAFKFKGMWTAEYSGHTDDAPAGADQLLYWNAIQLAKNSGAEIFSFGRTSLDNEGLLEYKRRWATTEEDLTDFMYYPGSPTIESNISTKSVHPMFYAASRLMQYAPAAVQEHFGEFCYRHLG